MKPVSDYLQFYGSWRPDVETVAFGGIKVSRVRDGVFSIERLGEGTLAGMITTQVQVAEPWCDEKTMVAVKSCEMHGLVCPSLRDDFKSLFETSPEKFAGCKEIDVAVMAPRWVPVVRSIETDKGKFEVVLYRAAKCTTLAEAKTAPPPVLADAGFFVMVMLSPEPKKEVSGNA